MAATSRLVKYERRQAVRSALLYIGLTALILFGLTRFGTQFVTSITGFLTSGKTDNQTTTELVAPPQIDSLPEITNQKTITIKGSAPAGQTVRITLNGETQDIVSNSQGMWTIGYDLHEGDNTMRAQVVDNHGNVSQEVVSHVTLDITPPEITSLMPDDGVSKTGKKEQLLDVSGQTEQDASVKVNDRIAIVNGQGQFTVQMPLNQGDNMFTIVVSDRAGNTTTQERHVTYTP